MVTARVFGVWFVAGGIPGFDMRLGRVWCCRFRRADVKIVFRQRVPTLNKRRLTNYKYRYEHGNRHNIQRVMYSFRIKLPNGRWVIRYVSPSLAAVHESILPTRHNTTSILTGNLHLVHGIYLRIRLTTSHEIALNIAKKEHIGTRSSSVCWIY